MQEHFQNFKYQIIIFNHFPSSLLNNRPSLPLSLVPEQPPVDRNEREPFDRLFFVLACKPCALTLQEPYYRSEHSWTLCAACISWDPWFCGSDDEDLLLEPSDSLDEEPDDTGHHGTPW